VWWVSRTVRIEREACCDDLVVATTGERILYARTLTRLAELCIESRGARLRQLPVAADGGDLLSRVRRIVGLPGAEPRWTQPRLVGSIAALAMVAVLTGYVAVAVEPPAPAPQDNPKPKPGAPQAEPAGPRAGDERPHIVAVRPADGATDVEPDTDIRIRFDRPMSPTAAMLGWDYGGGAGYRLRGPLRYDPDAQEFTLPVRLTPGRKHKVSLNSDNPPNVGVFDGFRAADGRAAAPFRWSFTTAGPKATAAGLAPRVMSVSPASDTEVAVLTPVEVTFDRPMDPASYVVSVYDPDAILTSPALVDDVAYEPGARRFTVLLQFPPHWNGEVRLEGFRGADGADAGPIQLKYRTLQEPLAPVLRRRVEEASESASLRALIERIRAARLKLSSVSEVVTSTSKSGWRPPGWHTQYESAGATFKMQGDRKFAAMIDEIMGRPFRMGSDGPTFWIGGGDQTVAHPSGAFAEKNIHIADPFRARGTANVESIIRDRKMDYLGEVDLHGRRCHLIRSWAVELSTDLPGTVFLGPRWYIDAATLLPVRVERDWRFALNYTYTRINEPIPDDEFRPVAGAEVRVTDPEPLTEGQTHRFLTVIDGTNGRMSVRWGTQGPKGSSGGLN
jgi:Bacterial Ig-like domain